MRMKLKKYKFIILSVFLVAGMSVAGWAFAFHYNDKAKSAESLKELKKDIQVAKIMPLALDQNNIILVLVSIGLVGFFGVRRQSKKLADFVGVGHPESRTDTNFLNEISPERQTFPGKQNTPDKMIT